MSDDLVTAEQVAAHLKVRPSTVKEWSRRGRIPCAWASPGVRRFRLAEVLAALAQTRPK